MSSTAEIPNETYDWKAAYERLKNQTEQQHPEPWIGDENDSEFVGIYRKLKRAPSKFGMVPVAIFEEQSGTLRSVWLHHTVLKNALYELDPKPGELVLIRWMGREAKEDGTDYVNYRVAVDRPNDPGLSWESVMRAPTEEELIRRSQSSDDVDEVIRTSADDDDIPF
jgi:hypothetical protein